MTGAKPAEGANSGGDADFAQAFKDLAKGERTAAALENHLDNLESKIDALLASVDQNSKTTADIAKPERQTPVNEENQANGKQSSE